METARPRGAQRQQVQSGWSKYHLRHSVQRSTFCAESI